MGSNGVTLEAGRVDDGMARRRRQPYFCMAGGRPRVLYALMKICQRSVRRDPVSSCRRGVYTPFRIDVACLGTGRSTL